jgi:hypothetical protein
MWKLILTFVPLLVVLGLIFLFFLLLPTAGDREAGRVEMVARSQFALKSAAQVTGLLVALGALLVLLQQVVRGGPVGNLLTAGMCVLGGVLLFESHWAIAVTFGLLAVAQVVERLVGTRSAGAGSGSGSAGGTGPADGA